MKLKNVVRLDSIPITEKQTYFTEEGYLIDKPILTSTGIFEYANPDGTIRRELRLPDDVFDEESLASYRGKPIVITHAAGLVNKDNVEQNEVGTILSPGMRSGNDVRAEIVIHNTDAMKEKGYKELSLGYNLDLDETPGMWNGLRYDAIQRNIRINHLALVKTARAGEQARLNIDSRDGNTLIGGKVMGKKPENAVREDGILSPEELQEAIADYKAKRGAMGAQGNAVPKPEPKPEEVPVEKTEAPEAKQEAPAVDAPVVEEKPAETKKPIPEKKPEEAEEVVEEETVKEAPEKTEEVPEEGQKTVEEKMQFVKERRHDRDVEGDPQDNEQAMYQIATQDEDIEMLMDIIDTLLAEREAHADAADEEPEEDPEEEIEPMEIESETADDPEKNFEEEHEDSSCGKKRHDEDDDKAEEEEEELFNLDEVDEIVRQRVELGLVGRELNLDGLENMKISEAKRAVITAMRPSMRLDGRDDAFINAAYEYALDDLHSNKDVNYQKKQMFNQDSARPEKDENCAISARERMIQRHQRNN